MITNRIEDLSRRLRRVTELTKLHGNDQKIEPATPDEEKWLLKTGGEEQKAGMSEGAIEAGKLQITDGSLAGMQKNIKRIDRHKRKAYLEVELFEKTVEAEMGLEVVGKS